MSKPYKVSVNDLYHFNVNSNDLELLDLIETETNHFHILNKNRSFSAEISEKSILKKTYSVSINNNSYNVVINDDLDILIKKMGFEVGVSKQVNSIKAPMPGLILDIAVKPGQTIEVNAPLLILEAMKMENSIVSPRQGVIKKIGVKKGETVDKGALLIEFE